MLVKRPSWQHRLLGRKDDDVSIMAVVSSQLQASDGEDGARQGYYARVEVAQDPRVGDKIRTQYLVCVRFPSHQGREPWQAQTKKTYSELAAFRKQLQAAFPDVYFPPAPPKRPFQRFDPRVLEERARNFQGLFDTLGDVSKTWHHRTVLTFFGAPLGYDAEEGGHAQSESSSTGTKEWFARTSRKTKHAATEREGTEIRTLGLGNGSRLDEDDDTTSEEDARGSSVSDANVSHERDARTNTVRDDGCETRAPEPIPFTWKEHPLELPEMQPTESKSRCTNSTKRKGRIVSPKAPEQANNDRTNLPRESSQGEEMVSEDTKQPQSQNALPTETSECVDLARTAARSGNDSVLQDLLASGKVSPDVADGQGMTLLHLAALFGHATTAMKLLEAGAHPMNQNHLKETPLQLASPSLAMQMREWMREHPDVADASHAETNPKGASSEQPISISTGTVEDTHGMQEMEEAHGLASAGNSSATEDDQDLPPAYTDVVSETRERLDSVAI